MKEETFQTHSMRPMLPDTKQYNETTKIENYRPIFLIEIEAEFLNKILATQIQQYIKKIMQYDQVKFIPGITDASISTE